MLPGRFLARLRRYDDIADIRAIARRYFAMNAFDGVVTLLGVLIGSYVAGIDRASIIITTGLSTAGAMGVSGFVGAYLTETAERERELAALERQTLTSLEETRIGRAGRAAVVVVTLVDGLSPALAALLVLLPFFLAGFFPSLQEVYLTGFALALVVLAALGAFLGGVSGGRRLAYALRTALAGLLALGLGFSLELCGDPSLHAKNGVDSSASSP